MKILGIILAGGKSTRMGQDKAQLRIDNCDLLERQFTMLAQLLGRENVVISGKREGYRSIADIEIDRGPLEGVRSVLESIENKEAYDGVLIVPIDLPFLRPQDVMELIDLNSNLYDGVRFEESNLPVFFKDLVRLQFQLSKMKLTGDNKSFSFKSLYTACNVQRVQLGDATSVLFNTNTPEEWNEALSKANHFARNQR